MNKTDFLQYLGDALISTTKLSGELNITSIESNLQNAKKDDLVFYNVREEDSAKKLFIERYNKSKKPILVTNQLLDEFRNEYNVLIIDNNKSLEIQKKLLDVFYPNKGKLKLAGITGTNGKTSIVNLCVQIAHQKKIKSASLGTLGLSDINGMVKDLGGITTPSYVDLRKIIYELQDEYEILFLEASSHALKQARLNELRLDVAGWTNLTQDHLDYHHTMDDYFDSKSLIFRKYLKPNKNFYVLPSEIELKKKLPSSINTKKINELVLSEIPYRLKFSFIRKNLELALNICHDLMGDLQQIDLNKLDLPLGRFSQLIYNDSTIVIDYAHTPDALDNICKSVREEIGEKKLIVVFGCGGDRDRTKRPLMAEAAERYADKVIITNDNPRFEDDKIIIDDILKGIHKRDEVEVIQDRQKAIIKGIKELDKGAVLIIAGKGHEDYQDIKGTKHPFSDFDIVREIIG